eukprot:jgi/Phyca11/103389/e_gw1.8.258.1
MQYGNVILLGIVAVFLAGISVASSLADIDDNVRFNTSKTGDAGAGSEERVGGTSALSKLDDLMNTLLKGKSSTEKAAIQALLASKVHPKELFGTLRLGAGLSKLDDNPELLQWFRLAVAYRKKNGDQALPDLEIYFMILRQHKVNEVDSLIQALTKTPGLKKLGTSMENSLSGSWINKALKLETDPKVLFNTLHLKEAGTKLDEVPVFHQWLKYVDSYRTLKGDHWFSNLEMLALFQKSLPEENVVTLLHLLRQTPRMTKTADTMQRVLFLESQTSHQLMLCASCRRSDRIRRIGNSPHSFKCSRRPLI